MQRLRMLYDPKQPAAVAAVYQQLRRWLDTGVFEALVTDVQSIARQWAGRNGQPSAI